MVAHDTATGATLDSRVLSNYSGGVHLVYNYTGAVDFEVIDNITPTTDLIPTPHHGHRHHANGYMSISPNLTVTRQ